MEKKHRKRRKYETASIYDLPTEVIVESILPRLSDVDVHNLGEACKERIEQLANHEVPLGKLVANIILRVPDLHKNTT